MLSQSIHGTFASAAEQRASDRRVLRLQAHAATPAGQGGIQIYNLSRTGMLVETKRDVPVGTPLEVEMPGGALHHAEVVWRDADLIGCRFIKPISQATLSAALLRAAPAGPSLADLALPIDNAALARLREHWDVEQASAPGREAGLPLHTRLWAIIGLGLASWAVPGAAIAWMF